MQRTDNKIVEGAKGRSIALLLVAEVLALAVWFSAASVATPMAEAIGLGSAARAASASAVQAGFAAGALIYAALGLADRFDPRRVFALSAFAAAAANGALPLAPAFGETIGAALALASRFACGALLAGVYPVGMKIAASWGVKDRGLLVGALVGALTLGSASPHLLAYWGGADWRLVVALASLVAALGGVLALMSGLGPHHKAAPRFDPSALSPAWRDRRLRAAYLGYLGHMWELYALWAWLALALTPRLGPENATLTTFAAIALGAPACVLAGRLADRLGKAEIASAAMIGSGAMALVAAALYHGPPAFLVVVVLLWGVFVIADSAQFSALVADFAPPERAGALMTLQTALGFALTTLTVQATPLIADQTGWPILFVLLALGPAFGVYAMRPLRRER